MKRKNKLPELLAPAGDFECLLAAVEAGADAVYVGGKRFGARAYAKNFDTDELVRAVKYCHLHGVKLYVTLNTLVEDSELADAVNYAAELWRIGVDALIIADVGAIREIRRHVPGLELHASTQMSVHSTAGAEAAYALGCSRVVLARELSREDIVSVTEKSPTEIEVFVHGAMCVCHSGQCLFSSLVGGRSGNRGECAQPCRLPYNGGKYVLSLKDMSLANHINELIDSGVASLKIEGRMKSAGYVYTVVSTYRRLLDEHRCANARENETLRSAFSRDGFTDGYFTGKMATGMTGIRRDEDKELSRDIDSMTFTPLHVPVKASATMRLGEPSTLTLTDGVRSVTVSGDTPLAAQNAPLTHSGVCERLSKMGNTFLSLSPSDISLELDEGINLSPSAINALRRAAADAFESGAREAVEPCSLDYVSLAAASRERRSIKTAQFFNSEAYASARVSGALGDLDICFVPIDSDELVLGEANGVSLPPIVLDSETGEVEEMLDNAKKCGVMYALVDNIGQISLAKAYGFEVIGDFRLNITNKKSYDSYKDLGVEYALCSPELTLPKARDTDCGVTVYGRIPLMVTERCFIKDSQGCERCATAALTDRKGERFPMMRAYKHRNIIFNSTPTYMGDRQSELARSRINALHLIFTVEDGAQISRVLRAYKAESSLGCAVRRIGRRESTDKKNK